MGTSGRHHLIQQPGLKLLNGHRRGQMIPDIGNRADGGLSTPPLKAVVFPMGGYLIQHAEIRGKQQRAVVQQPPLYHPLGAAGDLQIADGMSQVRFFRAGTPMAFNAAITGESTAS